LIIMLSSILVVGGKKVLLTSYVHAHTHFSQVQGLFPGSVVSLAGVPVGNIKSITFVESDNKLDLDLQINREFRSRLVEGTVAEIQTQGALGDKYVYLTPGPMGSKELPDGVLLPSTETDFMKMLTDRKDGAAHIIDLIKDLDVLISAINGNGKASRVMTNLTEASDKFGKTLGQLDALIRDIHGEMPQNKKLQKSLISLSNILEKVDQGKGTLGQLINDPSVHQSLKSFLGGSPRNRYMKDIIRETIQQGETAK
jgi:phospholipid/cholesterol/gamma-HCH transport system substrate-binding protein